VLSLIYAAALSFIIGLILGPPSIAFLRRLKFGQQVRSDGPKEHLKKKGTPTMGGIIILASLLISTMVFVKDLEYVAWAIFVTLGCGLIGLLDDFLKIVIKRSLGLKARYKLLGQILIAGLLALFATIDPQLGTKIAIPFTSIWIELGWLYPIFAILLVVGFSNAVNLTDGLDGLAAGTAGIAAGFFAIISASMGQIDIAIFCAALLGACLGFSWFNAHPAQVFMGDTGSLALGGALASVAILLKRELFLVIIGGVFVLEALSVMIQVTFFKTTGKRVFRMSPIHHHFELGGMDETKIVTRFWIAGIILGTLGLLAQ
jgi:phospho-N-acetylmuramoyl-pentapeptide-transferase